MSNGFHTSDEDGLSFKQIVLSHLKKILEISSSELRDGTSQVFHGNYTTETKQEDTRVSYIQAIENFAYILLPHFDKKAQEVFNECIEIMNEFGYQMKKRFKEETDEILKDEDNAYEKIPEAFYINKQVFYAKKLFQELNLLLYRKQYLKASIYSEGDEDDE